MTQRVKTLRNKAVETKYQRENWRRLGARARWRAEVVRDVNKRRTIPLGPMRLSKAWHADMYRVVDVLVAAGRRRHWYAVEVADAVGVTPERAERILRQLWTARVVRGVHHRLPNVNWYRPNTYVYRGAFPPITATPANP